MNREMSFVRGVLALTLLTSASSPVGAQDFVTIDVPGATSTTANGINDPGEIVGSYQVSDGSTHGFLLAHGVFHSIDVPGAASTFARGINDKGEIVGGYVTSNNTIHGFLWSDGRFNAIEPVGLAGVLGLQAYGINASGEIVGAIYRLLPTHPFFRDKDGNLTTTRTLGDTAIAFGINARGHVVGLQATSAIPHPPEPIHGFVLDLRDPDAFTSFDVIGGPGSYTEAHGINASGEIVGLYDTSPHHGFLRDRTGGFTTIDVPDASDTVANSINGRGAIVGSYLGSDGRQHGFLLARR